MHADVGVDAHRALLHLGVGGTDREQDAAELVDVLAGLLAAAEVGPADDLDERDAGAVEVDQRLVAAVDASAGAADVDRLAGVLLEVRPLDADAGAVGQVEPAVHVERNVVLADLVRLRHVGIEVVLAVEHARLDAAVEGQPDAHRQLDGAAVEHGQRPRQAERHRVDVGVGLVPEAVGAGGEELRLRRQLDVDLQAERRARRSRSRCRHGAASSRDFATRNIVASPSAGASTWTPTGRPPAPVPNGTFMPGWPDRFDGIV